MSRNNLKIVFFGTPDFAIPVFKALLNNKYNVSGVFAGHGPIELEAKKDGIKIFNPASLKKDDQVFQEFKSLKPDLCIVAAYGKILPPRYLVMSKYGFLNVHPSILPKYRGPSPVQTAILNGDRETGASIMIVDEEIDHGPVLANVPYKIPDLKYHIEVAEDIFKLGAELLVKILPKYINGRIKPVEQDHSKATFTKMLKREDGHINWSKSGNKIYNQIRALNPEPGTWTTWKGKVINIPTCDVGNPQVIDRVPEIAGMVRKIDDDIVIRTGTGYLILKSIQLEGGKEMDARSFVNGHPEFLDSTLE